MEKFKRNKKVVGLKSSAGLYFDYAASTPVDSRVLAAMRPFFSNRYGNPGSLHSYGQEAITAVDMSRQYIAEVTGVRFDEVIFTGCATEANNLALRGVIKKYKHLITHPQIIVSAVEHESILETAQDLKQEGVEIIIVGVNEQGFVNTKEIADALNERTILVSVMYGNNEIGTIQPIREIAKIVKDFRKQSNSSLPLLHTDAVQTFQFLDCRLDSLGVDMMTLSAHKIYGPKGIGALIVKKQPDGKKLVYPISSLITGGGQEFNLRSGSENTPFIVGFAKSIELAQKDRVKNIKKISAITKKFWEGLKKLRSDVVRNNPSQNILPHILNVSFPGYTSQDLLIKLDLAGIAVSTGSACKARSAQPSHVLKALNYAPQRAASSIRFSFGIPTMANDIARTLKVLREVLS